MTIPRGIIPALAGALLSHGALYLLGWRAPSDTPHYPRVQVDSATIVQHEPTPEPGRMQQITRPVSRPDVVATAPGAAAGDVAAFCVAAGWSPKSDEKRTTPTVPVTKAAPAVTKAADAATTLPPALQVQQLPQSLIRSGTIGRRTTDLWGVSSSGNLWRASYQVRAPINFRVAGDSVVVQGARFWWVRPLGGIALCGAGGWIGAEVGSRVPVVAGCGAGAWIAVR